MNDKPPRRRVRLRIPPKKGEVYWCDYPPPLCQHLPEYWKRRPVVIVSRRAPLRGVATVVPITSIRNQDLRVAVQVQSPIDGTAAWAICIHATTVAVSRLRSTRRSGRPSVSPAEYKAIWQKVINNLATP